MRKVLNVEVTITLGSAFLSTYSWGEQVKKGLFNNESGRSSVGSHFLEEMGFTDYLGIGLKWSLLNRRPFHPSSILEMDPFRGGVSRVFLFELRSLG